MALSPSAWAGPSGIHKAWLAAKGVVSHPKDSFNTLRKAPLALGRKVSFGEKVSILAAHHTGVGQRDAQTGQLRWQPSVIAKKARILRSSTFTQAERESLFKNQVVGRQKFLVKQGERYAPTEYGGKIYPNVYEAARAMARYWRVSYDEIDIVTDSVGHRSFGPPVGF